jgi:PPM family protein phosphatase
MIELKNYYAYTNQGCYLQLNEDRVEVDLIRKLYMIFDGFGGSGIGDLTVKNISENLKKYYYQIGGDPDSTFPFFYSHKYLIEGNALINSMQYAHALLREENAKKSMNERGGASGIILAEADNVLTVVHTGNCKGFLLKKGDIQEVCRPDSLEAVSKDSFQKQFSTSPMSGFGLFEDLYFEAREYQVQKDDVILLLTDGIYSRLEDTEISFIIQKKDLTIREKVEELCQLSNTRGNLDNQSALYLQY